MPGISEAVRGWVPLTPARENRAARRSRPTAHADTARNAAAFVPFVVGVALWLVSLQSTDLGHVGSSGLIGVVPVTWFIALASFALGALWCMWGSVPRWKLVGLYMIGVVAVLYATIPALTSVPQYAWTYKHIGVTQFLEMRGSVDTAVDIYNRWPGMFAFAAVLSKLTGVSPVAYATWIEPVFTAVDALLITGIARRLSGDLRVGCMAAFAFVCTDWVGQTYFSPQALAYTLDLAVVLVLVSQLNGTRASWLQNRLAVVAERLTRRPQSRETLASAATIPTPIAVLLVVALDVAIVATHQLTPYMTLLQVAVLTFCAVLRPIWLLPLLGLVTVGYLVPNFHYLESHYGLFSGLDPLNNASVDTALGVHRAQPFGQSGQLLSYVAIALAFLSILRLVWLGRTRQVVPIAALLLAPFCILFAQNYGGEASLRVFLFSSPWRDILVAWGLLTVRPRLRFPLAAMITAAFVGLFLLAALGNAGTNVFPASEVTASQYFYAHAPAGSVLGLAGEDFPLRVSGRYAVMAGPPGSDHAPDILEDVPSLHTHVLGSADLPAAIQDIRRYSNSAFLVFSSTQFAYAAIFHTTPAASLQHLEQAVKRSGAFKLWYSNGHTRIYQIVGSGS